MGLYACYSVSKLSVDGLVFHFSRGPTEERDNEGDRTGYKMGIRRYDKPLLKELWKSDGLFTMCVHY